MQIEFEELPLVIGGVKCGQLFGFADIDLDADGNAYVSALTLLPQADGDEPQRIDRWGGNRKRPKVFGHILLENVEPVILKRFEDDIRSFETAHVARTELGYGHLMRELV